MARCALFAALCAVCAWISIPVPPVRFSLQTLAMALALLTLGGKWGSRSIGLYLLLGLGGLPVFSGFRGGAAALLEPTGGFLWGFLLGGLAFRLVRPLGKGPALAAFQLVCYGCGCLWFCVYAPGTGLWGAVSLCVLPYLLPDLGKLALAWLLSGKLKRFAVE